MPASDGVVMAACKSMSGWSRGFGLFRQHQCSGFRSRGGCWRGLGGLGEGCDIHLRSVCRLGEFMVAAPLLGGGLFSVVPSLAQTASRSRGSAAARFVRKAGMAHMGAPTAVFSGGCWIVCMHYGHGPLIRKDRAHQCPSESIGGGVAGTSSACVFDSGVEWLLG